MKSTTNEMGLHGFTMNVFPSIHFESEEHALALIKMTAYWKLPNGKIDEIVETLKSNHRSIFSYGKKHTVISKADYVSDSMVGRHPHLYSRWPKTIVFLFVCVSNIGNKQEGSHLGRCFVKCWLSILFMQNN